MLKLCKWILLSSIFFSTAHGGNDEKKNTTKEHTLEVGYSINSFQDVNIKDAHAVTKVLAAMLVRKKGLNMSSETFIFDDLSTMKKALNEKKLDVVIIPPLEYFELEDHVSVYPFLVTTTGKQIYSEYLLLVSQKNGIKQLKDLKNRKLIVGTSGKDNIPLLWLDSILRKESLPQCTDFFTDIKEANKASQTVLPVFFDQADGCIITREAFNTMVELNPQLAEKLSIILTSPKFLGNIICINKYLDGEENRKAIEESLSELHLEPVGKQLLTLFRVDKLVPFKPSYLDTVRALYNDYQKQKRAE